MTDDLHTMRADIPGGLTLTLSWRDTDGASVLMERTWEPTRPDIMPADTLADLVEGLADYLEANGWPDAPTTEIARGFLGLNQRKKT
jgi:hypothetical protein